MIRFLVINLINKYWYNENINCNLIHNKHNNINKNTFNISEFEIIYSKEFKKYYQKYSLIFSNVIK